jgi:hypothetical protein
VRAFGEDRPLEAADALDRHARGPGDVVGALAVADAVLDLLGCQLTLQRDLELAEAGAVATGGGTQRLGDGQAVLLPSVVGEHERAAVGGHGDES